MAVTITTLKPDTCVIQNVSVMAPRFEHFRLFRVSGVTLRFGLLSEEDRHSRTTSNTIAYLFGVILWEGIDLVRIGGMQIGRRIISDRLYDNAEEFERFKFNYVSPEEFSTIDDMPGPAPELWRAELAARVEREKGKIKKRKLQIL